MGDTELYMDSDGLLFKADKSVIEKAQKELDQILILYDNKYEDLSINVILTEIADEIERKTGKRPEFGPWVKNDSEEFESISFDVDDNILIIDWES